LLVVILKALIAERNKHNAIEGMKENIEARKKED